MSNEEYQININSDARYKLEIYRKDDESYSMAIERLFREKEALMKDKDDCMRIIMKTPDAIALPNIYHSSFYAITQVLKMDALDDEKIECLKTYLRPNINENYKMVLSCLTAFKEDGHADAPILDEISSWINSLF